MRSLLYRLTQYAFINGCGANPMRQCAQHVFKNLLNHVVILVDFHAIQKMIDQMVNTNKFTHIELRLFLKDCYVGFCDFDGGGSITKSIDDEQSETLYFELQKWSECRSIDKVM